MSRRVNSPLQPAGRYDSLIIQVVRTHQGDAGAALPMAQDSTNATSVPTKQELQAKNTNVRHVLIDNPPQRVTVA